MRRILEVISAGLFLAGLELAVGTLSLTITRLRESFTNTLESDGVPWRFAAGIGLMVLAVVLAGVTVLARYRKGGIQEHDGCPKCGARTRRVRREIQHRILGGLVGKSLSARHCGDCGWRGLSYLH